MLNSIWRRWIRSLYAACHGSQTRKPIRRKSRFRARLERLEPRLAPASFVVNAQLEVSRQGSLADTVGGDHAVVFFESAVTGYQDLSQGLSAGTDAVVLDSAGDGVREMAAFLKGYHNLGVVGVVAHGAPGAVTLGTATLDAHSLGGYTRELAALASALGVGGELDLWSCDAAAGLEGAPLIQGLAAATGAGVAASDHLVGPAAQGGAWQLDVKVAGARGEVPFSAAALGAFPGLLSAWNPAAALTTARSGQTATLLSNGKVLVTGGFKGSYLSSAELYDPVSNTWSAAASMATPRYAHTATLLSNGEVLVTGGFDNSGILSSAELYDPVKNTWSAAHSLAAAREQHTATLLPNGQVLVAGGVGKSGALSSAELYDPATNTWSSAGSLATGRSLHAATLLADGKVLITGGVDDGFNPVASAELYDPVHNTWSSGGTVATPRYSQTATLLGNGKVLIAGGIDNNFTSLASAELYDPSSNTWSGAGSLVTARAQHTATLLTSGQVLATGGVGTDLNPLSSVELYDPVSATWSSDVSMSTARANHTATLLGNGQVLVAGGDNNGTSLSSAEMYNPAGVVAPVAPVISVTARGGVYTGEPYPVAALVTGAGNTLLASFDDPSLSYTYYVGATVAGTGSVSAPINAGTYTVVAHWSSNNPAYLSADSAPVTFIIAPAPITVTADAQSKPYGAADPPLTYHVTKGTLFSGDSFSGALTRVPGENPGTYAIQQGTLTLSANYALTFVGANLTVTPASHLVLTGLSSANVTAGDTVTFTVTAEDSTGRTVPGYTGNVQLTSTDSKATVNGAPVPVSYTFAAKDAGVHTFAVMLETAGTQTITVTDQAQSSLTVTTSPITVVLPFSKFVVSVSGGNSATAGNAFLIRVQAADRTGSPVTSYSGPSSATLATSPVDIQGNLPTTIALNSNGFGFFLGTLKTAGSYTLTATAGSFTGAASITVAPAGAVLFKVAAPATITTGHPFNLTVTALDSFGNIATGYVGRVHFTSTDPLATLPADSPLPGGVGIFSVTLKTGGSQTITATDRTTSPPITGTSGALPPALMVTSFTPTATGFTASFNKPFNPTDITLYGTGVHTVQDVTLVGAKNGLISGSLIIDPTSMIVTFNGTSNALLIANNFVSAVLPDDTYTATLISGSGSNGFLDALGLGLDGASNGDHANYTATFTTHYQANATPVLGIPDFARGPDDAHTIKVPNDGFGIPITLYNAAKVTDVTFSLSYNPSLLNIVAGFGGANSDATDAAGSFTMVAPPTIVDATHAEARFHFVDSNPQGGPSTSTTVVLGDILATVPNSAASIYKAKELLQLGSIVINQGAITGAVGANGVHVNAYLGDVTGNGTVDGLDLATAFNVALGTDTGFAAYQDLDPTIIGDVANDFSVDAGDISTIATFTAHLPTSIIPAIPTGLTITPVGADPALSLAGNVQADSKIVSVAVLLDNPHPLGSTGMTEAVLALTYDPTVLGVSPSDITLGSIPGLGAGWQLDSVIDATGKIGITLYSTTAITAAQAGSLVNITFHVLPGISVPATAVQLVSSVMANGQQFSTQVDDAQGQLVLSPGLDRLAIETAVSNKPLGHVIGGVRRVFPRH